MLKYRPAELNDAVLIYNWANDPTVRANSYSQKAIKLEEHLIWFKKKISDKESMLNIYEHESDGPVGMVRIDGEKYEELAVISIIISSEQRGQGYASWMLKDACIKYKSRYHKDIIAYIFVTNQPSFNSFNRAGFELIEQKKVNGILSYIMVYPKQKA
jgi:RimJ/RimL family protein N-acetyltransferase